MRLPLAACVLAILAGCADGPIADQPSRGDPAVCTDLFLKYDRAVRFHPANRYGSDDAPAPMVPAAVERPSRLLVREGCLTSSADLDAMPALAASLSGRTLTNSGASIPQTPLHVGIVTGLEDEREATRFFRGLGYRSRGVGAPTLGRRIYIGPFVSQGALDEATAIARDAGFIAPIPTPRTRL